MTDPTPPHRRSPMGHDRDAAWSVTDKAAIIIKSYGLDDPAAARAVVALVLEEAAKVAERTVCDVFRPGEIGLKIYGTEAGRSIRALIPKGDT